MHFYRILYVLLENRKVIMFFLLEINGIYSPVKIYPMIEQACGLWT